MTIAVRSERVALREHVAAWKAEGKSVALVPTMGALHAGHMSLVARAKAVADRVVVTIFVNPTQFAPNEDFATYPRDLAADGVMVEAAGADLVYAPELTAMYPPGFATTVTVAGPGTVGLEDRFRPTHFAGVATVVAKLLIQAQPSVALFGEKDFQQLRVIERLSADLDLPVRILGVPVARDVDGLALSSRNVHLDADERRRAPALYRALARCVDAVRGGAPIESSLGEARESIADAGFMIDYVEARRADTLAPLEPGDREPGRILAAARLGRTRLIDNVGFSIRPALPGR